MLDSFRLLQKRYLENIKTNPKLYIGIELEFPIVEKDGRPTNIEVAKDLLKQLSKELNFEVEKYDDDLNPIQLLSKDTEDRILFEVSYTTIEFAFERAHKIQEVENRFEKYLQVIQRILSKNNHEIQGYGVHPQWFLNDNSPVKSSRYQMLMEYLAMSSMEDSLYHNYPEYGAFICGSQVQLDVSRENFIRVINAFNQIESAKAYLFANSEFWGQNWPTTISRDIFWEESMHGKLIENVGVNSKDFQTEEDFFNYLNKTAIFTAIRNNETYYFSPIAACEYLEREEIEAYSIGGKKVILTPQQEDFATHRSYQYQDLTTRGTIEFRSVCTQPLSRTFAPAAFHLGLLVNIERLEKYLLNAQFFEENGRDYKALRRLYSRKELSEIQITSIKQFSKELLEIAKEGLLVRNLGEEVYLKDLEI